jgi:alkaline phosphatase D
MTNLSALVSYAAALALIGCGGPTPKAKDAEDTSDVEVVYPPSKIGFGSCVDSLYPMPVLSVLAAREPELFLFLGDNIYGDTEDMTALQRKYDTLEGKAEFQEIKDVASLVAVWDDHDYGANNAGKDFPMKAESRRIFLDFWEEPEDSPRRTHDGIYHALLYEGAPGPTLQIILLDTRYFRDDLTSNEGTGTHDYLPNDDPNVSLLGDAQWLWLEEQLAMPADLRIIGTSIQFAHGYTGSESWTLFPAEQEKLLALIRSTGAEGVMMLSGDVHYAEFSKMEVAPGYTLFDATSSAISRFPSEIEENPNRIGNAFGPNNAGWIEIDWQGEQVDISIIDVTDTARLTHSFSFDALQF